MGWTDTLQVFCADVGSITRESFAWARRIPGSDGEELHRPESIESLAAAVVDALRDDKPVALGFEAPLFIPVPENPARLGKARPCDALSPSWSSNVGASVLATAMAQVPWTLRFIHDQVPDLRVHLQWPSFAENPARSTSLRGIRQWCSEGRDSRGGCPQRGAGVLRAAAGTRRSQRHRDGKSVLRFSRWGDMGRIRPIERGHAWRMSGGARNSRPGPAVTLADLARAMRWLLVS